MKGFDKRERSRIEREERRLRRYDDPTFAATATEFRRVCEEVCADLSVDEIGEVVAILLEATAERALQLDRERRAAPDSQKRRTGHSASDRRAPTRDTAWAMSEENVENGAPRV